MSTTLTIAFHSDKPGCPPTDCYKAGAVVALGLIEDSVGKSRDGSGWLVGVLSSNATPQCQVGASDWTYIVNIPESEISDEVIEGDLDPIAASDVEQICCLRCGDLMTLDKFAALQTRALSRESFRFHNHDATVVAGTKRLFRNHSAIEVHAIEASCEAHLSGYPSAEEPQPMVLSLETTPAHQATPFGTVVGVDSLTIDPASATPLTGRVAFVPPIQIDAGKAVGMNLSVPDPLQHLGLEIHIDFRVLTN